MKISTKGRYGLEALADMAIYGERDYINLKSISERQGISDKYLEQLFIHLKRSGLIDSLRGAQGGYRLSRDADKISVKDVLNSLEGPLALVDCIVETKEECCNQFDCCVTRVLWQKIMEELNFVTKAISLADIAMLFKESQKGSNEYYV
ncbi:MAG: Rrf2 family transcriptional regulator [Peptostreptococcaceae bacterium]|nr:Rrf2 family transcriptional regulator [Peptostreptococcaceae bacterium]